MNIQIEKSWKNVLKKEFEKPYFRNLSEFIDQELKLGKQVFPKQKDIFTAFNLCPIDKTKVVIIGQDPYHSLSLVDGKQVPTAHGLCFSVVSGAKVPPSLKNIYKELQFDLGDDNFKIPIDGNLNNWANQGVLMINTTFTVEAHNAMSHVGKGWEEFTDSVIKIVSEHQKNVVFLLWGRHAKAKKILIDNSKHLILESAHPSPFSAYNGFFGCKHFSKTNEFLSKNGLEVVDW